jgi:hypothetical protein
MDKYGAYDNAEVQTMLGNAVLAAFTEELLDLLYKGRISQLQYDHFYETHITLTELVA